MCRSWLPKTTSLKNRWNGWGSWWLENLVIWSFNWGTCGPYGSWSSLEEPNVCLRPLERFPETSSCSGSRLQAARPKKITY
jgi:hypothetical protein